MQKFIGKVQLIRIINKQYKETVKDYLNKYSYSVNEQVEKKIDARPEMIEEFNFGLEETIQWINNQMIVYMCTILEIAINDFFKCLFIENLIWF